MSVILGCGGGTSQEGTNPDDTPTETSQPTTPIDTTTPPSTQPDIQQDLTFSSADKTSRFLQQATFGATANDIAALTNTSASNWFKSQLVESPSTLLPIVISYAPPDTQNDDEFDLFFIESTTFGFWKNAITGADQLRQRMAFALSEILVVSNKGGELLTDQPTAVASYQDILINNAFGNYRTLLEAVTYSPAMGHYLTYLGNQKADPITGRVPDENYARELLQLFTLGVVELNNDGSIKMGNDGITNELYSNKDITGLAKVMTGLDYNEPDNETTANNVFTRPMTINPEAHSDDEKSFLGLTIPAGVDAQSSIRMALDHIFAHPNLPPFITKQLIQRLVSSNPSSAYITRTVNAFKEGKYILPDGSSVGTGERGDLSATFAAILFDEEARNLASHTGGKIREPILRFTQWARAFNTQNITPQFQTILWDTSPANLLAQHPYRSPSVFNFFRPGYTAPGTTSAANGLVAPELQITNTTSIPGYINFMTHFITGAQQDANTDDLNDEFANPRIPVSLEDYQNSFITTYDEELKIASDIDTLIDRLDLLLTAKQLSQASKTSIKQILSDIPADEDNGYLTRVQLAVLLVMTTPDYIVQK
jgi:uncharacterized protein (DUF1800 family)